MTQTTTITREVRPCQSCGYRRSIKITRWINGTSSYSKYCTACALALKAAHKRREAARLEAKAESIRARRAARRNKQLSIYNCKGVE